MSIILRDYNSYYTNEHILIKSKFSIFPEKECTDIVFILNNDYIRNHMNIRFDEEENFCMFVPQNITCEDTKFFEDSRIWEELSHYYLSDFFAEEWDYTEKDKKAAYYFLNNILKKQIHISDGCYIINSDWFERNSNKLDLKGTMVYDYYILIYWLEDNNRYLNIAVMYSD